MKEFIWIAVLDENKQQPNQLWKHLSYWVLIKVSISKSWIEMFLIISKIYRDRSCGGSITDFRVATKCSLFNTTYSMPYEIYHRFNAGKWSKREFQSKLMLPSSHSPGHLSVCYTTDTGEQKKNGESARQNTRYRIHAHLNLCFTADRDKQNFFPIFYEGSNRPHHPPWFHHFLEGQSLRYFPQ